MKKAKSLESKEFSLLGFERAVFLFGLSLAIPLKKSTYFENNVFLSGAYFRVVFLFLLFFKFAGNGLVIDDQDHTVFAAVDGTA